jgi:hypothetical protein
MFGYTAVEDRGKMLDVLFTPEGLTGAGQTGAGAENGAHAAAAWTTSVGTCGRTAEPFLMASGVHHGAR